MKLKRNTPRSFKVTNTQSKYSLSLRKLLGYNLIAALACGLAAPSWAQEASDWTEQFACPAGKSTVDTSQQVIAAGFNVDQDQTRSLSAELAGVSKAELANLEIAWAIGFPGQGNGTGAAVLGNTLYVNGGERLLALEAESGCVQWSIEANSRNTPSIGELNGRTVVAVSVGRSGDILVVDAKNGEKIWQANGLASDNGGAVRGGVTIYDNKVIVPISASGVGAGMRSSFECCVGHGAVVALSGKDGSKLWEYHTMPTATYNGRVSSQGVKQRGPSGAPIWSFPMVDAKRNRVLVTTGENTSHPGTNTSDAIIAIDLDTGKEAWVFQAMEFDIWNMACRSSQEDSGPNCPWNIKGDKGTGRDFDFGAGAIIVNDVNSRDLVLGGQKSGDAWALDANTGELVWNIRFGEGTALGGVHWGITTDGERLYVPISDPFVGTSQTPKPGVYAVDLKTGKEVWAYEVKANCEGPRGELVNSCESKYGFSVAPLTVDGAVIAGTLGGEVFILDGENGKLINRIDTIGPVETINDVEASGGSIDSHGISAGAGLILINSGYRSFGQTAGNALIAYRPASK
ncbi:hypothetical protein NBRC116493_16770 [Aurantivibrio infirmus]